MRRLTGPEFKQLRTILGDRFDTKESLNELAIEVRGELLDKLAIGESVPDILNKLISKAQSEKWLIELIESAQQLGTNNSDLQTLKENLQGTQTLGIPDPYHVYVLPDGSPFINRDELRKGLRGLEHDRSILIVDGDKCVGKTYSLRLIRFIRENTDDFKIVFIDLDDLGVEIDINTGGRKPVRPEDIGEQIAIQMNFYDMPKRENEQDAAWVNRFCAWLTGKLQDTVAIRWIVIDSFDRTLLSQGAQDLIKALAKRITINLPMLRLVLLGYRDTPELRPILHAEVSYEQIRPLEENELITFFIRLYENRKIKQNKEFTDDDISGSVARVFRQVNPEERSNLGRVNPFIAEEVRKILG